MRFNLLAPAKLNLFLKIGSRRTDGFHDIFSLFQTVSLADEFEITVSATDELVSDLPLTQEENLAFRAIKKLREKAKFPPLKIKLTKNIPPGSGLGGASSDAAAILKGLNNFFDLGLSQAELKELSLSIGSDVPFFLIGGTCLVSGRGEIIRKVSDLPVWPVLLFIPDFSISTRLAYQWWDNYLNSNRQTANLSRLDYNQIRWGENDFEKVVFERFPILREAKELAKEVGVEFAGLSGSGSAIFALSQETEKLKNLKEAWQSFPGKVIETFFESSDQDGSLRCQSR